MLPRKHKTPNKLHPVFKYQLRKLINRIINIITYQITKIMQTNLTANNLTTNNLTTNNQGIELIK